ncbi:unnamed protein product, partial [Oppiella nova]
MLNNLQIKCQFSDNGCPSMVPLDQLSQHVNSCPYDASKCGKCFCDHKSGHDCIQSLLAVNTQLKDENKSLLQKMMSNLNTGAVMTETSDATHQTSFESVLSVARRERFNGVVIGSDMKDDMVV